MIKCNKSCVQSTLSESTFRRLENAIHQTLRNYPAPAEAIKFAKKCINSSCFEQASWIRPALPSGQISAPRERLHTKIDMTAVHNSMMHLCRVWLSLAPANAPKTRSLKKRERSNYG